MPPDPHYGGRPPKGWAVLSGGQNQDGLILLAPGHWALRRRKVRSIPDAQAWASVMSLPCSSSPHQIRFAGLWRGPRLSICAVRTPPTPAKPWQLGNGMYASVLCAKFPIPLSRYSCPLCKVRVYDPPDHRRTQQVGKQEAVYGRIQAPTNFDGSRAWWPESRRMHGQNLGRRNGPNDQRGTLP